MVPLGDSASHRIALSVDRGELIRSGASVWCQYTVGGSRTSGSVLPLIGRSPLLQISSRVAPKLHWSAALPIRAPSAIHSGAIHGMRSTRSSSKTQTYEKKTLNGILGCFFVCVDMQLLGCSGCFFVCVDMQLLGCSGCFFVCVDMQLLGCIDHSSGRFFYED